MLKINNVRKEYSGRSILDGINLDIYPGTIYGLVGKNGAGKTTLLSIISGLKTPTSGACYLNNEIITERTIESGAISFLPDSPLFYEYLTVKEYLLFLCKGNRKLLESRICLTEYIELDTNAKIKSLSRGNRQKLGIVSAIMTNPKLVLLDEPTSALDPIARKKLKNLLINLSENGTSIIISTHILSDLEGMCDRIGFLNNGVIAKEVDLANSNGDECIYKIKAYENIYESEHIKICELFGPHIVDIDNNIITLRECTGNLVLNQASLLSSLARLDIRITSIEMKSSINLEKIMEEVLCNE